MMANKVSNDYRLPLSVVPTNYRLLLNPHLNNGGRTFDGELAIKVEVHTPTSTVSLHTHKLNYTLISLSDIRGDIPITYEIVEDARELLIIRSGTALPNGDYTLRFIFEGRLDDGITGFYATETNQIVATSLNGALHFIFGGRIDNGKVRFYASSTNQKMAASKFEPTYARQAFPCFDEPGLKATFDISLVKPFNYIALSNMNEISSIANPGTGTDTVTFATSVPMSTYLACFVVCDYKFEETPIDTRGLGMPFNLRCYARDTEKTTFALDIGKRATEFYIQYYQVPFPLPKLDMIGIPDFTPNGMEHWGLITYQENMFLIDNETASAYNKVNVANIVAHELAHMWFGNLVTMKWWNDLWLNEGFATYMSFKALDAIEPTWTKLNMFLMALHAVLREDSKLSSHQIVHNVTTPGEIVSFFDEVSYLKGASVLRMLEGFIGARNFQQGVTDYLNIHKFSNAVTQDLLDSLEPYFQQTHPSLNLRHILDTWTKQVGYPLVSVAQGPETHTYVLTQTRFLADPEAEAKEASPFNYRWAIPVTYKTMRGARDKVLWFADTDDSVTITLGEEDIWLKVNNDQMGYYRVNYPREMWLNLVDQLQTQSDKLSISDRAHLLNDVYELAAARVVSYELALQVATYLPYEKEHVPWVAAAAAFQDLDNKLLDSSGHGHFQQFVQKLIAPMYGTTSWEQQSGTSILQSYQRSEVLGMACKYALVDARQRSRQLFLGWLNSYGTPEARPVEPDLRKIVYYYGMKQATSEEWDSLWQIYLGEEDAQERINLLNALTAPDDPTLLTRYLTLAWEESNVRGQDYFNVVGRIGANPAGTSLVWDYVRAHWTDYVNRFTLNSWDLGQFVPTITATFHTVDRLEEMETFFAQHAEAGAGESARRRALEAVRNNIQWTRHNEPVIATWLSNYLRL